MATLCVALQSEPNLYSTKQRRLKTSDLYKFEHDLEDLEELLECLRELELHPNDPRSMARMQIAVDTVSVFIPRLKVADRPLAEQIHNTCVELGEMYLKSKRFDESKAVLLEGLRRQPTSGRAWIVLAESLLAKGDAEGAIEAAELGLRHLRDDARGVEILGDAYVEIESLSAAVKAYSRLPKCRRGATRLQWKLAKVYRQMNELEKAMEEYREVSLWAERISDVHYEIGTLWARIYGGMRGPRSRTISRMLSERHEARTRLTSFAPAWGTLPLVNSLWQKSGRRN